jgi:thioredoxin 1
MAIDKLTDENFENEVLKCEKPYLAIFSATSWCAPCKMLHASLPEFETKIGDIIKIGEMDIDSSPNTPTKYSCRSVPSIFLFKAGEAVATTTGAKTPEDLANWVKSNLG